MEAVMNTENKSATHVDNDISSSVTEDSIKTRRVPVIAFIISKGDDDGGTIHRYPISASDGYFGGPQVCGYYPNYDNIIAVVPAPPGIFVLQEYNEENDNWDNEKNVWVIA